MERLQCGGLKKFIVVKRDDLNKYIRPSTRFTFDNILEKIKFDRLQDGKNIENEYIVINTDEPYAPEVIEIMKRNGHWG